VGFFGGGSKKAKPQIVGYKYSLGIHFILGYANADGIKQIWVGEKCVWPAPNESDVEAADASANEETINIDAENIFGGDATGKEGGVSGSVDIQYGACDQQRNSYLVARLGEHISAYRGLLSVILKQVYVGMSAYIKPWSFLIKRTDKLVSGDDQWYTIDDKHIIHPGELNGDDLNAVHIIRECLIDKEWGLGFKEGDINDANFKTCADTLKEEGFGLSIIWDNSSPVEEFIDEILAIIAGSLYQNLSTGKWEIALTREDYVVEDLECFDEDQIIEVENFSRSGYGEVTDQVTINWHDKIWNKNRSITISDPAMITKQGGRIIEKTYNYFAICNKDLANRVASRELQLATSMLANIRIKANRQMSHLKPNDVFKFSWENLGITNMVVRVLEVNYGNLTKNEIELNCCEDVFGTVYTSYEAPPDTQWEDPVHDPVDTTHRFLMEIPYWYRCNYGVGQDLVDVLDDDNASMFAMAAKPDATPDSHEFDLLVKFDAVSDFDDEGYGGYTSTATLKNDLELIGSEDDWVDLENVQGLDLISENTCAVIENSGDDEESEIVRLLVVDDTVGAERIKIARGILDTKPSAHSIGDRIWFISLVDYTIPMVSKDFTKFESPRVKFLTKTGRGILAEEDATEENTLPTYLAFNSRMIRPYLPGNLKINTERFPEYLYGQPTLTWNHRDRTNSDQIRTLVKHTYSGDYGPETDVTYTIQFLTEAGVVKRTITGLSGKTYTYPAGEEVTDFGKIQHKLRIKLWAVRAGYDSWQVYDIILERPLRGSSAGQSIVSGTLSEWNNLVGSLTGQSVVSGTLVVI